MSATSPTLLAGTGATARSHRTGRCGDPEINRSTVAHHAEYIRPSRKSAYNGFGGENADRNSFRRTRSLDRTKGAG